MNWQPADPEVARLRDAVLSLRDAVNTRLSALETALATAAKDVEARRNRLWLVVAGLLTGIVAPLIVAGLIAFLHLRGK